MRIMVFISRVSTGDATMFLQIMQHVKQKLAVRATALQ